jgi:hypothetical protein
MTYGYGGRRSLYLELADADGNLERPLLVDGWYASDAKLTVRGGFLAMDRREFYRSLRFVKPEAGLLERFARLAESVDPERAVQAYAQRWGLLDLCVHQLPIGHSQEQLPVSFATSGGAILTFNSEVDCRSISGKEPVASWLYWSRQAAALLAVLSRLRGSDSARSEDWLALAEEAPWASKEPRGVDLREDASLWTTRVAKVGVPLKVQQDVASGAIATWLRLAGVGVELRWRAGVPEIGTSGRGQLAALGLQILLAGVDSSGWLMCPGCGNLHAPPKKPFRPPTYCEPCRTKKVPQQLASRRFRAKKKAADPAFLEAEQERARQNRKRTRTAPAKAKQGP